MARFFLLLTIGFVALTKVDAAEYPIIFVHGHKSNPTDTTAWKTWHNAQSAMWKILSSHYGGYIAGNPLRCNKNTVLSSTGNNTKVIYNFSYYRPDGGIGVIGSNGKLVCQYICTIAGNVRRKDQTSQYEWLYGYDYGYFQGKPAPATGDKWAENLALFIDKVLVATGASKVDIVAHSMGGLVARTAIKNYGCDGKVRKLLTIGTPNRGWHGIGDYQYWLSWIMGHADWQIYGEDLEMNVDPVAQDVQVYFTDLTTGGAWTFANYLSRPFQTKVSTIAGTRGKWHQPGGDDGVVLVTDVPLPWADFNAKIYASHGWGNADNVKEICLLGCTYTEEFIKNWIIDDDISHNGAQLTGAGDIFFWSTYPCWDSFEVRVHAEVNDYNKALVLQSVVCDAQWQLISGVPARAFPIYKYHKSRPGALWGDPVFSTSNSEIPSSASYNYINFLYDMEGVIKVDTGILVVVKANAPAKVEILKPSAGDVFTVQSHWDKLTVEFKADFYWANIFIYFSPDEAGHLTPVYTATNYKGGGETKTIQFAMPQVNSPHCRVFVRAWLDNFIKVEQISEYFTIRLDVPYDLYAFTVDENKVGLDWRCGTLLGFEVQRKKAGENWQVIATGYWGPGSKTFYDETVTVSLSALPNAFFKYNLIENSFVKSGRLRWRN